jgi:hypothetical protein
VAHLNRCFPKQCETLGAEGTLEIVREGIEAAAGYGIRVERDVCTYIDLMFFLGRHFDSDESLTEIAALIGDKDLRGSRVLMPRLLDAGKTILRRRAGDVQRPRS